MNVKFKFLKSKGREIYSVRFFIKGVRYQQSLDTDDRREAEDKAHEYLNKVLRQLHLGVNSLSSVIDSYLNFIKERSYYTNEKFRLEQLLNNFGDVPMVDLTREMCRDFYLELVRQPSTKTGKMLCETSKRAYLGTFKALMNFAISDGKMDSNPFNIYAKGKGPKYERKGREFSLLELQQLMKTLKSIKDNKTKSLLWRQFYYFFMLIMYSGARPKELFHMKWMDFSILDENRVKFIIHKEISKNRKMREVEIPKWVYDDLTNIKKLTGYESPVYVFDLKRRDSDVYSKKWVEIRKMAGVKEGRLYDTRHTYISQRMHDGVNPKALSEMVGHSSTQITLDVYTHSSVEDRKKLVGKVKKIG